MAKRQDAHVSISAHASPPRGQIYVETNKLSELGTASLRGCRDQVGEDAASAVEMAPP